MHETPCIASPFHLDLAFLRSNHYTWFRGSFRFPTMTVAFASIAVTALAWSGPLHADVHSRLARPRAVKTVAVAEMPRVATSVPVESAPAQAITVPSATPPPAALPSRTAKLRSILHSVLLRCGRGSPTLVRSFAFFNGWAEVVCFQHYSAFANMMTGNWMRICTSLIALKWVDVVYWLLVVLFYIGGAGVHRAADLALSPKGAAAGGDHSSCAAIAPVVLALFVAADWLRSAGSHTTRWTMLLLSAAFGMVNTAGSEATGVLTHVVTGHLQKLGQAAVDGLGGRLHGEKQRAAQRSLVVMLAFGGGMLSAAASMRVCTGSMAARLPPYSTLGVIFAAMLWACSWPPSRHAVKA